jgi:hypothetical protein
MQIQFGSDKDNLGKINNTLCLQHISSLFESPQLYCRSHFEDIHILGVTESNLFTNAHSGEASSHSCNLCCN